jgi:ParB family chromosome partitioning protein
MPKAQDILAQSEEVYKIRVSEIHPFVGHPFRVVDNELMQQTVDSIIQFGVLNPAIVRPDPGGGYEMVSGHRRLRACELAGFDEIPVIVRNLTDD